MIRVVLRTYCYTPMTVYVDCCRYSAFLFPFSMVWNGSVLTMSMNSAPLEQGELSFGKKIVTELEELI